MDIAPCAICGEPVDANAVDPCGHFSTPGDGEDSEEWVVVDDDDSDLNWEEHVRSLRDNDRYDFSYPIEYIIDRLDEGDDPYVIGTSTIDVQLIWFDGDDGQEPGYQLSYQVNGHDQMPVDFNGSEAEFLDMVYSDLDNDIDAAGIGDAVKDWPLILP